MNIKYSSSDTDCRENQLILMGGLLGGEDQRTVTEWQAKQQYESNPDWKKPSKPPRRKSGGIISAIIALIKKQNTLK